MKFFLDANVVIDLANETQHAATVEAHWRRIGYKHCALSAITVEELQRGVLTGPAVKKGYEVRKLKALLAQFRQAKADLREDRGGFAGAAGEAGVFALFAMMQRAPMPKRLMYQRFRASYLRKNGSHKCAASPRR